MSLLLLLACHQGAYETPERLLDAPQLLYGGAAAGSKTLGVTGAADEWTLTDAEATWTLRSPAEPDLSRFDGVEGVVVADIHTYEYDDPSSLPTGQALGYGSVAIMAGESVAYSLEVTAPSADHPTPFGAGFVRYGDALGTMEVEYWLLTIRALVFATDDGEVALGPADPTVLQIGGERYLTTVLSAWESDVLDEEVGQPKCGGIGDRFSYEMVWLPAEVEAAPPSRLRREGEVKGSSCG